MNKITNGLETKCNTCQMLDPTIEMTTAYNSVDILQREIIVTCSNIGICGMYKEFRDWSDKDE